MKGKKRLFTDYIYRKSKISYELPEKQWVYQSWGIQKIIFKNQLYFNIPAIKLENEFLISFTIQYNAMDCKEIQPVHSKGDQSWAFFGRNDAKAETPVFWPPHGKSWLIGKDSDAGRDWGQEEEGTTEDAMAEWHHQLDGYEFEWTLGDGDGQGGLACCDSWSRKESDMTERLNWTETKLKDYI